MYGSQMMTEKLGRYEILGEIGQGGFAVVYRARDTELDRLVALKELKPILLQDTSWAKRFRREARAIARLDHPHIVTVYDVGEVNDRLYIVMRLIDGPSLEELIASRRRLAWTETAEIIDAVAEGLDFAHGQGILHRDLKPANILMDPSRGAMLSDFGFAKLAGESSTSMTASGSVVGTPHYIAPEVWEGQGATSQADIYALGCILYEMLTGEKVFKGETPPAVMMAHFKPLSLPQTWPEGVPPGVTGVLKRALSGNPANRYATAGEMAAALTALAVDAPVSPAPVPAADVPAAGVPVLVNPPAADASDVVVEQQQAMAADASPPVAPVSPPAAPPDSVQVAAVTSKKKKITCLWLGAAGALGLVFLVLFGTWGMCAAVEGIFNAALPTVEVGSTTTENISIPVPDVSGPVDLQLESGFGRLTLAPGASVALVEGTATYNVAELKPEIVSSGRVVRLEPETHIGFAGLTTENIQNHWDLRLGAVPMTLTIDAAGTESNIELGGLPLSNLTVNHGASSLNLALSAPNPLKMDMLEFAGGASSATLTGLSNAHASHMTFTGGAGSYIMDFSGDLRDNMAVSIEAGLGSVTIIVPENIAAKVTTSESRLANVTAVGAWQQAGDGDYFLPGEGAEITINVQMGAGNLELRNPR